MLARRQPDLTVCMEQVHKPHNVSAIIRTADAVGVHEVHAVWPGCRMRTMASAAAGSNSWVQVKTHRTIGDAVAHLKGQGMQILATHLSDNAVDFREIDYTRPTCILMGQEKTGITHLAKKDCNRMSGGELQMVLIARALINEPKLIILDEPETGLDFHNQILVLNMIDRLSHEDGISAIMNTHYPTNAMSVADEAFMMNHKGTFFYGSTEKVLTEKNISVSFDVNVVVNEFSHHQKKIKSIVPVSLTDKAM